ncbi:hypothetical protein DL765_002087 [Monosporascus sp. GIB2]|nr:hypothetical protein DL765_002087 [Monosporascus sp. GIB2]
MSFFDWADGGSVISSSTTTKRRSKKSHHRSDRSRSRSRSRSSKHQATLDGFLAGAGLRSDQYKKHNGSRGSGLGGLGDGSNYRRHAASSSRASFFGLGGNASTRSFFGLGRSSSSSYTKRAQPRSGFVARAYRKLKRLLRDLVYWAKRHPVKVFLLVIMPLVTGGALTALLARFGLRLPPFIERWLGVAARTAGGDPSGLVGEAVRMATGGPGGGGSGKSSAVGYSSSSVGGGGGNKYGYSGAGHGTYGGGYGGRGYRDTRSTVSVERGRDGDFVWERRREDGYRRGGGGFMNGVSRFFSS